MKLYTSLIYRELKLTRKRSVLMLILLLLLSLLLLTPIIIGERSGDPEMDGDLLSIVMLCSAVIALTGGFMAGTNNGLQKADISSGWKRYSFVLPPTAKQQAMTDLMTKLCCVLFFGLLSAAYALVCRLIAGINIGAAQIDPVRLMLNIYLGAVCAVMLIDVLYSYIIMFAKTKKDLEITGIVAFLGAGLILKVVGLFSSGKEMLSDDNAAEQSAKSSELISEEALNRFVTSLVSGKTTLYIVTAFVVICVLFFLAMWRSHERREP